MTFKKVQESKEIGKEIVNGQEVAILQPEVHREVKNKKTGVDYDSEEAAKADVDNPETDTTADDIETNITIATGTLISKIFTLEVLPVLNTIDLVLIMSVNPGFGGQKFMEETLEKVKILRKEIDNQKLKTQIEIDGGINFENAKMAKEAGVDILVSGTTIFKENGGNLKKNIQFLRTG